MSAKVLGPSLLRGLRVIACLFEGPGSYFARRRPIC